MSNKITKEDLQHLRGLKVEIESLRAIKPRPQVVPIFYKDYKTGRGVPKTDVGLDDGEQDALDLATKIARKIREREKQIEAMEDWIEDIADPVERAILRFYYVEGLSQQEIGDRTGYSQPSVSRVLARFWVQAEEEK